MFSRRLLRSGHAPQVTLNLKPYIVSGANASLRQGNASGPRLKLAGVTVRGAPVTSFDGSSWTADFANGQYQNRVRVAQTIKAWGGNLARMELAASCYNNEEFGLTKAQQINRILDWVAVNKAHGLMTMFCWWDSLDGPYSGANWPAQYHNAFQMMSDVVAAIGDDPYVFYEPWNEPNNVNWAQWQTVIQTTLTHWRSAIGYNGVLFLDMINHSSVFDASYVNTVAAHDSSLLGGNPQAGFVKHNYAMGASSFDESNWRSTTGNESHVILESEFGNWTGGSDNNQNWANEACAFFAQEYTTRGSYAGACSFVMGPWSDANAMTAVDNVTPTVPWGSQVKDMFLGQAGATVVPGV